MMVIRPETPADYMPLRRFIQNAFETASFCSGAEAEFVEGTLRQKERYIASLAFVATEGTELIGHIMLTHLAVQGRKNLKMLLLAPLAVRADKRRQGVGSRLVRYALQQAKEQGFDAVALAGNPAYYGRFGFSRMDGFGLHCQCAVPASYALVLALKENALNGPCATVIF